MTDRPDPRDPWPALARTEPARRISAGEIDWTGTLRVNSRSVHFTGKQVEVNYLTLRRQLPLVAGEGGELALIGADGFQNWFIDAFQDTLRIRDDTGVRFTINPEGLVADPEPWTPGQQFWTLGNGETEGHYLQMGGFVIASGKIVLGSTSTVSAGFSTDFPVAPHAFYDSANNSPVGIATYVDASGTTYHGRMVWSSATRARFTVDDVTGTYAVRAVCSDTVPMTWTTSDQAWFTLIYLPAV